MFPYQYLVILIFNLFGDLEKLDGAVQVNAHKSQFFIFLKNWEIFPSAAYQPTFENPNFPTLSWIDKNWEVEVWHNIQKS